MNTPEIDTSTKSSEQISFHLNGATVSYDKPQITVRHLVELAGVAPEFHRIVQLHDDEQSLYTDLTQELALTEGARFETIHVTVYSVDDEEQVSVVDHLAVREIMSNAGVDPETHFLIELRGHEQIEHRNLDEKLQLRQDEKFISIYHGPTPVS